MPATLTLPAAAPFDFNASLRFLREFPAMAGEQAATRQELTKALRIAGHTVVAELRALPDGRPGLAATLHCATPPTPEITAAAADRLRFFLSLDDDLEEFYALGRDDAGFAPVIDRLYGYHQVKFGSPLENLVWAILIQRVPMPVASSAKRSLIAHFDNRLTVTGVDHVAFPDLEQLTGLPLDLLGQLIGNERKARFLYAALRDWARVDEEFLRAGPYEEVKRFLLSLSGIGEWSANIILIRGLGRMDQLPLDKPLLAAARRSYGPALTDGELRSIGDRYGSWQGCWAHYLRIGS